MNVVLFGDSLLGRFGKPYISQLERLVSGVTIYNCAAGGFNSTDGLRRADYIANLKPDVVIFSFGGNDTAPWKTVVSKQDFIQNMRKIFAAFTGSRQIILLCPDVELNDNSQTEEFNMSLNEYYSDLKEVCEELNVEIVDANSILTPLSGQYHVEDGLHMNDDAYQLVIKDFALKLN